MEKWEENTERRLGIVEQKVDKVLDPETGVYPKLTNLDVRIKNYVITILLTILGSNTVVAYLATRGK